MFDSQLLLPTSTSKCAVKQLINNTCLIEDTIRHICVSDSWNKIATPLPTSTRESIALFNKLIFIFTKLLFGSHKHASLHVMP